MSDFIKNRLKGFWGLNANKYVLPETANVGDSVVYNGTDWVSNNISEPTFEIGQFSNDLGGVVFYVDNTGKHGLVCSMDDLQSSTTNDIIKWYASVTGNGLTRASGNGIYAGIMNTTIIITTQVFFGDDGTDYAAQLCNNYNNTHSDWYLPSIAELLLLRENREIVNITIDENRGTIVNDLQYWSSTEVNTNDAFALQMVESGGVFLAPEQYAKSNLIRVRAVRRF
jgi:hypothetical protein